MLRKISAVLAALVVMTGLTLAVSSGADAKSVLPAHGSYAGVDHGGRMVTFSFSGNTMSHFTVGHTVIGGAHVCNGAWHETCHNGMCIKGMWMSDTHVTGSWRQGGGAWVHFNRPRPQRARQHPGAQRHVRDLPAVHLREGPLAVGVRGHRLVATGPRLALGVLRRLRLRGLTTHRRGTNR